jgi:hypothetical protein
VGPRAVLDAVVKRNIPNLGRESNPRTPIVQPLAHCNMRITIEFSGNALHQEERLKEK